MRLTLWASLNLAHSLINVVFFALASIGSIKPAIKFKRAILVNLYSDDILFIWKEKEERHAETTKPSEYRLVVLSNEIIECYDHM